MKYPELVGRMTLEEKASLLSGQDFWLSKPIQRLGIPALSLADGPSGVRRQAADADHLGLHPGLPATCFPTSATLANSWNTALSEEVGQYLGKEAVARQVSVLLGPGLNIKRSPLCGRNFEYFSEDPYLSGKMAAATVRGIQSQGIAACPKHFAVNSQELRRMASDSVLDERTLREIYLTGFEITVKESAPLSIMSSYNKVNGTYANENTHLLQTILREEWGFDGFVVTDWGGSNSHVDGVKAGSNLEMPATAAGSDIELVQAVQDGQLSEEVLDKRVDEFLQVLFRLKTPDTMQETTFDEAEHHTFARKAAEESAVLLKNEGNILPLKKGCKVALIGDFAKTPRYQGAGSSLVNTTRLDSTLEEIETSSLEMIGYEPGFARDGQQDDAKQNAALALAQKAEVVLLYLGLDELLESEGMDRASMKLRQNQTELLEKLTTVNPNIVVVLSCGAPVEMPWLNACKALLHGYLGGQAGASALLNLLTGKACPSGKLAESYPFAYEHTPACRYFPGHEKTAEYREGLYVGYRYYETAGVPVQFPFGFGLSYTSFSYSHLVVSPTMVTFTVQNTGKTAGAEIAQLYIGKQNPIVHRPAKELKGFAKVLLAPGESKEVCLAFDDKTFRFFDVESGTFAIEKGVYTICVGASSADIRLQGELEVAGIVPRSTSAHLPSYYSGKVQNVPDAEFETLLGRPMPEHLWNRGAPLSQNDSLSQTFYAKGLLARLAYKVLTSIKEKGETKGKPDLNILFIYNMPFRAIAKMMNGMVDMAMVNAMLRIVNGHFFSGCGQLAAAWWRMRKAKKAFAQKLRHAGQEPPA